MGHPATVIRPRIEPGRRVIAVSDIHGNLPYLQGLLKRLRFSPDDVLILVGDLLEKGQYSLGVLRFVMELQKKHTVYPLCGNCDYIDRMFLEGRAIEDAAFSLRMNSRFGAPTGIPNVDRELWPVLRWWGKRSVLLQMAMELGHPMPGEPDFFLWRGGLPPDD